MSKFSLTISNNEVAKQIADLLNSGKQLWFHQMPQAILGNPIEYLIELDQQKVIAVVGLERKAPQVTEIKHLVVHPNYRKRGLGKKMLELGIRNAKTEYVFGTVGIDNVENIRNNFRVGMIPIGKYNSNRRTIIVFAQRRHNGTVGYKSAKR